MEQKFNIFNQAEMPSIMLCTPNLEKVHAIDSLIFGTGVKVRYNAISEFMFSIPESIDGNQTSLFVYDLIKTKKYLHIENIGYFIMQEVDEDDEGLVKIKEVKCESLESELKNKKITGFERISVPIVDSLINVKYEYTPVWEGNYISYYIPSTYDNGNQVILSSEEGEGLINTIINSYIPNWSIDTTKPIPVSLITEGGESNELLIATIVRGFKISDSSIYSFLVNDVEKAYGCAIIFNREERSFYFEDMTSIQETNIFLSYDNLIKQSNVVEYSDEIATCLSCYGDKNISINYSNPLGDSKIYNFDYFKTTEWMTQSLIDLIDSWKIALEKEINGATTGDHLGQAWGTITSTYYESEDLRYLDALYDICTGWYAGGFRGFGYYYLYPIIRRNKEIAGQKRLLKTVDYESNEAKYYKTNITFLYTSSSSSYPATTDTTYYGDVHDPVGLTSSSQIIETYFYNLPVARKIRIRIKNDLYLTFSGTATVIGTDNSDAYLEEDVILTSEDAFSGVTTTGTFKTITSVELPAAYHPGDVAYILCLEDIGTTTPIPSKYQLKNIYKWNDFRSYLYIRLIQYNTDFFFNSINQFVAALKTLESGEKFSNFVERLFLAYEEKARMDTAKTFVENMIAEQEILKASAIELGASFSYKKEDHMVNIKFLREYVTYGYPEGDVIPSESNIYYTLNDDANQLEEQRLIDAYIIKGTTTEGETVDYWNAFGGLNLILSRTQGLNYFISKLQEIMSFISSSLSLETFFGANYQYLLPFIIENTYQNEYTVNYSDEIKDKIATSIELYNQSLEVIERISSPRYEFSIDSVNFINLYDYKETFIKELALGKKVRINIKNSVLNVILLEMEYSFDDFKKIDMTFGNRLRLDDVRFQYTDFVGQIYKTGSNVSFDKNNWEEFSTSYKDSVDSITKYPITDVNNTSLTDLESSNITDQTFEVSVTKSGLLIRKKLDEENYSSKEILLTNGVIAYTSDEWATIDYINNA